MSDILRQSKNLKLKYAKSRHLTSDLFNQVIDLIMAAKDIDPTDEISAQEIRNKLQSLVGGERLRASAISDLEFPAGQGKMTPVEIRDALQSLVGSSRLDAAALTNLSSDKVSFNNQLIPGIHTVHDVIMYLLKEIQKNETYLGLPDEDGQVLTSTVAGVRSWTTIETDKNWQYIRLEAGIEWDFEHPLNKVPSIIIRNELNKEIKAAVDMVTETRIIIRFNTPQIGTVELN